MKINRTKIQLFLGLFLLSVLTQSCGWYKRADVKDTPVNVNERVKRNIQEGRGIRFGKGATRGGDFDFASANPLWRASIEILDFVPLSNASYSGGIIITDWFSAEKEDADYRELKISVRFLTNEIRADGIRIIVHKKKCNAQQKCTIKKVSSAIENELQVAILKKAAIFDKEFKSKNRKKRPKIK